MALANNPYHNLSNANMKVFDFQNLQEVEDLSAGLDQAEVLSWYGLSLDDLSGDDLKYFNIAFNKGRANAKRKAVSKLFEAMSSRQAKESAISYLARFSEGWATSVESDGKSAGKFSFRVSMGED